jgi:hypothetical protein
MCQGRKCDSAVGNQRARRAREVAVGEQLAAILGLSSVIAATSARGASVDDGRREQAEDEAHRDALARVPALPAGRRSTASCLARSDTNEGSLTAVWIEEMLFTHSRSRSWSASTRGPSAQLGRHLPAAT